MDSILSCMTAGHNIIAIESEGFLCHSRPCGLARKGTESGPGSRAANGFERFHPDGDKNS